MTTLQEIADREGISRQMVWLRTPKGRAYYRAYLKVYKKTDKYKAYKKAYRERTFVSVAKLREAGLIK